MNNIIIISCIIIISIVMFMFMLSIKKAPILDNDRVQCKKCHGPLMTKKVGPGRYRAYCVKCGS